MGFFSKKKQEQVTFTIDGMHCNMCSANLQRGLSETEGVIKAKVSFEEKSAQISYDPEKTDPDRLVAAVTEIGYSVVK